MAIDSFDTSHISSYAQMLVVKCKTLRSGDRMLVVWVEGLCKAKLELGIDDESCNGSPFFGMSLLNP